jgi:hypothetical protein
MLPGGVGCVYSEMHNELAQLANTLKRQQASADAPPPARNFYGPRVACGQVQGTQTKPGSAPDDLVTIRKRTVLSHLKPRPMAAPSPTSISPQAVPDGDEHSKSTRACQSACVTRSASNT